MRRLIPAFALLLGACASTLPPATQPERPGVRIGGEGGPMSAALAEQVTMSALARDYVGLILEIGEHEPGYVDAYYGPAEWQAEAKAGKRSLPELLALANRMVADLEAVRPTDPEMIQRKAYLIAHTRAAAAQVALLGRYIAMSVLPLLSAILLWALLNPRGRKALAPTILPE